MRGTRVAAGPRNLEERFADISFAFQPIVDLTTGQPRSHEALVRGTDGGTAASVFLRHASRRDELDAVCRAGAIALAVRRGLTGDLNLNFSPKLTTHPSLGLSSTIEAAQRLGFPPHRLVFEATEDAVVGNPREFAQSANEYRRLGVQLAIDDFGAGYAGLNLLAEFLPDFLKLDMQLVRGIHTSGPRQAIVRGILQVCGDLGIELVAEGVETLDELRWFEDAGVRLYQGFLFARPALGRIPNLTRPMPRGGRD